MPDLPAAPPETPSPAGRLGFVCGLVARVHRLLGRLRLLVTVLWFDVGFAGFTVVSRLLGLLFVGLLVTRSGCRLFGLGLLRLGLFNFSLRVGLRLFGFSFRFGLGLFGLPPSTSLRPRF